MKKFTKFLLLCTLASSTTIVNAQTQPVVGTANDAYAKAYVIGSYNRGGYLTQSGNDLKHVSFNPSSYWYLSNGTSTGSVKIINVKTGRGINRNQNGDFNVQNDAEDLYVVANPQTNEGLCISATKNIENNSCIDANRHNDGCGKYAPVEGDWDGTTWVFTEVPGYFVSTNQGLKPVDTEQYHFDSKVITLPKPTKKLRFRVFSTNNGALETSGIYPFFTLGEFYLYDSEGTQVTLTVDNFSSNSIQSNDGSLAGICDNNKATHFHTQYNSTPNTYHYFEITLPTEMQSFKFSFDGRDNKANVPALIQLLDDDAIAKADAEDAVLTKMPAYKTDLQAFGGCTFGDGIYNTYTATAEAKASYESARTTATSLNNIYFGLLSADQLTTAIDNLKKAKANISIKMPADGSFIRVRSKNYGSAMPYLTSEATTVNNTGRAILKAGKDGDNEAITIFYYKDNTLTAYATGFRAADNIDKNNNSFLGYNNITDGSIVKFTEATEASGVYNVIYNNGKRKLYANQKDGSYFTDALNSSNNHVNCCFWLEDVTSLPVTVSDAGYATLCAPVALTIPANVEVYTASFGQTGVKLTPITGVIPANTGVVIEANAGKYNFAITTSEEKGTSDLIGNIATENVDASKAAYILGSSTAGVGFYKLNSTDRTIKGGRAYYVAPTGEAPAYLFNGATTGIDAIKAALNDVHAPIYDLSGRKVANAVKGGVYIKNGKKFIVK